MFIGRTFRHRFDTGGDCKFCKETLIIGQTLVMAKMKFRTAMKYLYGHATDYGRRQLSVPKAMRYSVHEHCAKELLQKIIDEGD